VLALLFDAAPDPVFILRPDHRIQIANPAFLGLAPGIRPGSPIEVAFPPEERATFDAILSAASRGRSVRITVRHTGQGRGDRTEYRVFPLGDGRIAAMGRTRKAESGLQARLERVRSRLPPEVGETSPIDTQTGLWNREYVLDRLAHEWCRCEESQSPLSCLLLRVEGLDKIARDIGTEAANGLLRAVGNRLKSLIRGHDIVGRFGRDRFLVLALNCDREGARSLGQRLVREVAATQFSVQGRKHRLLLSAGCGWRKPDEGGQPNALLIAAECDLVGSTMGGA
jgi:diguanylate cyclase (GGDEF)-like protein